MQSASFFNYMSDRAACHALLATPPPWKQRLERDAWDRGPLLVGLRSSGRRGKRRGRR